MYSEPVTAHSAIEKSRPVLSEHPMTIESNADTTRFQVWAALFDRSKHRATRKRQLEHQSGPVGREITRSLAVAKIVSEEQIRQFGEKGATVLRNVFSERWLRIVDAGISRNVNEPSKLDAYVDSD